jgi:four helix bundle protein
MGLGSYRELETWKVGMDVVEAVYLLTKTWPFEERFGLTSQTQRAAVSIPANIAEGYGRTSRLKYIRHLTIAWGSLLELETHLQIAVRVGLTHRENVIGLWRLCQTLGKLLRSHIRSLRKSTPPSTASRANQQVLNPGHSRPNTQYPTPNTPSPIQ